MAKIDGKKISADIKEEVANEVSGIKQSGKKIPHLATMIVGNDPASETYVKHKIKACETVGFKSSDFRYDADISQEYLLEEIRKVNENDDIDGLIVQLPLPDHISESTVIETVDPKKDVDGFHPVNMGRMVTGSPAYLPATPAGVLDLMKRYNIETEGKNCVIIGRSNIVGRPLGVLLSRKAYPGNCTVTVCHSRTKNIGEYTRSADILIVAIGKMHFITADMVKDNAVVFDVGIHRVESDKTKSGWKLHGDVDYANVAEKASYITPVPGGIGPMTIASLLQNTLKAAENK